MAMAKAATYLSENHDIKITVLEMAAVKKVGYKVALEVTLIPLSEGEAVQSESQDVEPKRAIAAVEKERVQALDNGIKRRILEHFRRRKGTFMETPSIHLAQLTEAMLMGQIDGEFRQSAQPAAIISRCSMIRWLWRRPSRRRRTTTSSSRNSSTRRTRTSRCRRRKRKRRRVRPPPTRTDVMLKYRIEAVSTVSLDDALGQAMTKAAAFASEDHDMHVAILELAELPDKSFQGSRRGDDHPDHLPRDPAPRGRRRRAEAHQRGGLSGPQEVR